MPIEPIYAKPLIWRRIALRTITNLETLHRNIQAARGWLGYHFWEFADDEAGRSWPQLLKPRRLGSYRQLIEAHHRESACPQAMVRNRQRLKKTGKRFGLR